jgi:hypothetical protein
MKKRNYSIKIDENKLSQFLLDLGYRNSNFNKLGKRNPIGATWKKYIPKIKRYIIISIIYLLNIREPKLIYLHSRINYKNRIRGELHPIIISEIKKVLRIPYKINYEIQNIEKIVNLLENNNKLKKDIMDKHTNIVYSILIDTEHISIIINPIN